MPSSTALRPTVLAFAACTLVFASLVTLTTTLPMASFELPAAEPATRLRRQAYQDYPDGLYDHVHANATQDENTVTEEWPILHYYVGSDQDLQEMLEPYNTDNMRVQVVLHAQNNVTYTAPNGTRLEDPQPLGGGGQSSRRNAPSEEELKERKRRFLDSSIMEKYDFRKDYWGVHDVCNVVMNKSFYINTTVTFVAFAPRNWVQAGIYDMQKTNFAFYSWCLGNAHIEIRGNSQVTFENFIFRRYATTNSPATDNEGNALNGGIFDIDGPGTSLTLINTVVQNGTAPKGGHIYANNNCSVTLINSKLENGHATWMGGSVYLENGAALEVIDTQFKYNKADTHMGEVIAATNSSLLWTIRSWFLRDIQVNPPSFQAYSTIFLQAGSFLRTASTFFQNTQDDGYDPNTDLVAEVLCDNAYAFVDYATLPAVEMSTGIDCDSCTVWGPGQLTREVTTNYTINDYWVCRTNNAIFNWGIP